MVAIARTITNWVREFEKWSPHLRVVSFFLFFFLCVTVTHSTCSMADKSRSRFPSMVKRLVSVSLLSMKTKSLILADGHH